MINRNVLPSSSSFFFFFFFLFDLQWRISVYAQIDSSSILLQFKQGLIDTDGKLDNWTALNPLCTWNGVLCNADGSVVSLALDNFNLNGTLSSSSSSSSSVCSIPSLTEIHLSFNNFAQLFPPWIPLLCPNLTVLDLSQNYFFGPLPQDITGLTRLQSLSLQGNYFTGTIPKQFGDLPALTEFYLSGNQLLGEIAPELGNLTMLEVLDLAWNQFNGSVPVELGKLRKLQILYMEGNGFTGSILPSLGYCEELQFLDLSQNSLTGVIPRELMYLQKLTHLSLWQNYLTGEIPSTISNLTSIVEIDLSSNQGLMGNIPEGLTQLQNLTTINLFNASLTGLIPEGLASLPKLWRLSLFSNGLTGALPEKLGLNSKLGVLDVVSNSLTGSIPTGLCSGGSLIILSLSLNRFSGGIPSSLGHCPSLSRLQLNDNQLSGLVPAGLWGSLNLSTLYLQNNRFEGSIPPDIRSAQSLGVLMLDNNSFSGNIPPDMAMLRNLSKFSATNNNLSGSIPTELSHLLALSSLDLSGNRLSGPIQGLPSSLNSLSLAWNNLSGSIPDELATLLELTALYLQGNHLNGSIPESVGKMKFVEFNVSFNELVGTIPSLLEKAFSATSFMGNPGLCVEGVNCVQTPGKEEEGAATARKTVGIIVGLAMAILLITIAAGVVTLWRRWVAKQRNGSSSSNQGSWNSFQRIDFSEQELLMGTLDEKNLVGSGAHGRVYRVQMPNGKEVAVKKLSAVSASHHNLTTTVRPPLWKAEVETLGLIRHKNIVKLLCSHVGGHHGDLLVYEYMPNGSLGDILHGSKSDLCRLSWQARYNIALGAARGLSYLHHDCIPPILHRDIKSNNILLDANFEVKLADFGLAKAIRVGPELAQMTAIVGSVGYIAPEYAYTLKINEKSDVYGFGVVLLELVTGKKAVMEEGEVEDGVAWVELVHWVRRKIMSSSDGLRSLLDPRIVDVDEESVAMVVDVALHCTSVLPQRRPSMQLVLDGLEQAHPRGPSPHSDRFPESSSSSSSSSSSFSSFSLSAKRGIPPYKLFNISK